MSKEIYISSTPHETRLAIVENEALTEIYYERENEYTLAGSIYNGKVTRVLPGMQSSFVDIGLDRDAFLYITDFMEETGETADFDAHAGGESQRAPREGGGDRGRSGRGDRGERNGDRAAQPRTEEPTDSELFTDAVAGLDPARPVVEGGRGERSGSRRGGRNRRDRGDRNVTSEGAPRREREPNRGSETRVDAPRPESILAAPPPAESTGELGEGAPGADGSRRWRGRRGRRGSRDRMPGAAVAPVEQSVVPEIPVRATGPVYNSYGSDEDFDVTEKPVAAAPETGSDDRGARAERGDRGGRADRGRRDRGPRVPRGFAPTTALYQVEGSADAVPYGTEAEFEAPAEPIILPGESLSKYRAPSEQSSVAHSENVVAPVVSEFVAAGWDGGAVLPGETIRPRGGSAGAETSPRSDAGRRDERGGRDGGRGDRDRGRGGERGRGGRDDRGRSGREDRGPRPERTWQAAPAAAPVAEQVQTQHAAEPGIDSATSPELLSASHGVTPLNSTFVAPPPMPAATEFVAEEQVAELAHAEPEEFQETVHEFEPQEASASYRVDPAPRTEFRQSTAIVEEELVEEEVHESAPAAEPVDAEHEVTSIFATGEMHSDAPALVTQDLVAAAPSAQGTESSMVPVAADAAMGDQEAPQAAQPWFAPGSGVLEEEMLEDEEEPATLPAVEASRYDEHEAHGFGEQETLENAADLATMLREMSIDQLTRNEPAALDDEDEDDFEEDFLEEDQDFANDAGEETEEEGGEEADESHEEGEFAVEPFAADQPRAEGAGGGAAATQAEVREPQRDGRRDDRRRDGRRGERGRRSERERDRGNAASDRPSGDRDRGRGGRSEGRSGGGDRSRHSMQSTNLPAISDLLKPGQEILCQIAKEPIAKKGARITSHIALPGRFLVFMPTVNHTGVSRKIESDGERRRLKEILLSEKGDAAGGFIVRTAAEGASEEELRSDLRFLLNLWADIKTRSESSKSPALIYHDLNLVERVLRDQVTDNFSAIWVDTETDYERILRFLQRFQPSLIRRVKLYTKETPLFEQFGITEEINKALRSKVWLKSGGSIVINQTEALVAIDINTGKFVGKTARLEDTIVKTNLDAIPEIVRQIRLRDLGGIIIIDFIDMDERKNRNKVMAALEDELKTDRAPSKVLPFNDFGLVAITRKRVKQSLERTLSTTCGVCAGTGMVKSPVTVCNDIYIEMRKMNKHLERGDVMLRVHPEVVKQLKSTTSRWLQEMEEMVGKTILVKSDPSLHPEQFDLH